MKRNKVNDIKMRKNMMRETKRERGREREACKGRV